jgi:hypothetical protein
MLYTNSIVDNYSLSTLEEINNKVNALPKSAIIFLDVDDTIIMPKSNSFRVKYGELNLIDKIKKEKNEQNSKILSYWRSTREVILVDPLWPENINNWRCKYKVFALTKMDSGKFGQIESMEKWRYNELESLNIMLSSLEGEEVRIFQGGGPSYYNGIFMTGVAKKSEAIEKLLPASEYPKHIMFIDDKMEYIKDVEQFCQKKSIGFTGICYNAVEKLAGLRNPEIEAIQTKYLIEKQQWLEDLEAEKLIKV